MARGRFVCHINRGGRDVERGRDAETFRLPHNKKAGHSIYHGLILSPDGRTPAEWRQDVSLATCGMERRVTWGGRETRKRLIRITPSLMGNDKRRGTGTFPLPHNKKSGTRHVSLKWPLPLIATCWAS